MNKFNVIIWDINSRTIEPYDVLPYFRREYKSLKKKDRPITREQWKEFVRRRGMYMFWARCEYEILISEWPPSKEDKHIKIDVWQQIDNNLDLVVDLLMSEMD